MFSLVYVIIAVAIGFVVGIGLHAVWVRHHPTWVAGIEALQQKGSVKVDELKNKYGGG